MTNDYLNENINISYDHRNLITEINRANPLEDPPTEIKIRYRYDESGNRTRKTIYQSTIENPPPIPGEGDLPPGWIITKDEYFVRDAQGKEIAIYQGYELDFWNVFGMGNEGRIKSTGTNYFYLKDHLGSIRAVLNNTNNLVEAQDYDAWGYLARSWDTTATRYKFTGKERDNESGYDYFGARYYNSRISVWQSTDPLFEKHIQFTPYNYVLGNPMIMIDPDGKQLFITGKDAQKVFDEWDKDYLDIDIKSGRVSIKSNASKSGLNDVDLLIWDFVENHKDIKERNAILYCYTKDEPKYGDNKVFLGDAYGGYIEVNGEIIGEQYIYLPQLEKLKKNKVIDDPIGHALYEGIVGTKLNLTYEAAHKLAEDNVSQINRIWFELYHIEEGNLFKGGVKDKRNSKNIIYEIYYIYDKENKVFIEK